MIRPLNLVERLFIYGVVGLAAEIAFTATWEAVENGNRKLHGITSLYAFFIYGLMILFMEKLYVILKPKMSLFLRGVVYLCCCYGWEFSTGFFLKNFDACPWDYASYFKGHFMGLITAEYIPVCNDSGMSNFQLDFVGKISPSSPPAPPVGDLLKPEAPEPIDPDDSENYVELARQEAQCIVDLVEPGGPFHNKAGSEKLRTKLRTEFRVLNSIHHYEPVRMSRYVKTSNIYFYSGVRHTALQYGTRLQSFFQVFHNHAEDKADAMKIEVDMVLDDGATWVKVIARSPKGLAHECLSGGPSRGRSLVNQGELWQDVAKHYQHVYRPPMIIFNFIHGCPDYMKIKLNNLGIKVETPRVLPLKELVVLPPDFEEAVPTHPTPVDDDWTFKTEIAVPNTSSYNLVNLDIPAVFALISTLTNGGENNTYQSQMLNAQAEQERLNSMRKFIESKLKGKKMIICKTAYDAVQAIMRTVAGPKEFERVRSLMRLVEVVKDQPSNRVKALRASDKVNERAKIIFGTGDHHKAVTLTSNAHFVRAAASQGVRLSVIMHEPRALGELKLAWTNPRTKSNKNAQNAQNPTKSAPKSEKK